MLRGVIERVDTSRIFLRIESLLDAVEQRWVEPADGGCRVGWSVWFRVPSWAGGRLSQRLLFVPLAGRNLERELAGVARLAAQELRR